MEPITYSLTNGARRSDQFYADLDAFTDEVVTEAAQRFGALVADYAAYLRREEIEPLRTEPEYGFELLTLGVLWRVYAHTARNLGPLPQRALNQLAALRERGGRVKKVADRARGVLSTMFLSLNGHHESPAPTLDHFEHLIDWLAAAGDFKEEVRRLRAWQTYFEQTMRPDSNPSPDVKEGLQTLPGRVYKLAPTEKPFPQVENNGTVATSGGKNAARSLSEELAAALDFAAWFEARSLDVLGDYTANVEAFLTEKHPAYRWRENRIFTGRRRVEYHLNVVGTTIMNRAFREAFQAADRQIVFVPPCMRTRQDGTCEATPTPYGERCAACEPTCRVHQVTQLGAKHGFAVFMLPDDLEGLSPDAARGGDESGDEQQPSLGIVGVSCALTNTSGGWKTRRLGIPAQGVLLDYVGCYWHWHKDGIPTAINLGQLLRVIGKKQPMEVNTPNITASRNLDDADVSPF